MAYRNPSPPPGASLEPAEEDIIGDTVFSKSWLLSVMAKTVADTRYKCQTKPQAPLIDTGPVNKPTNLISGRLCVCVIALHYNNLALSYLFMAGYIYPAVPFKKKKN